MLIKILVFGILPADGNGQVTLATQDGYELLSELEFMSAVLDSIRAENEAWTAPFARLTPEQLEEIERERPGLEEYEYRGSWL